ncbi:RagB/SusD family nutrient uptake outer membrane protein [Dysgonomonas capnocytophagoides]|uniref:RagB/SusD family nutrient uptake outer membrane protein n=1 Tax=Dysgonomonas capnocytophagoides TaxID=45254 RepID=UPI00292309D5|nr:RagB/SusD family nutrient uptake outer membrane protein [Dysgonomonas capnocytophagoides]
MKKLLYILILSSVLVSCSDSLNVTPVGTLMSGNFPATDDDAIALTNGVYAPNVGISTSLAYLIDLTTETTVSGENPNSGGGLLGLLQWDPTNSYVTSVWTAFYVGITSANDVIDKLSDSKNISETIKNRSIGEAKFLRAYYYQYAVQFWGEVPLVLHNADGTNTTRASVDDVYTQIVADLQDAAELLPNVSSYSDSDKGRASKGAAHALLAKVYLVWGQTSDTGGSTAQKEKFQKSVEAANNVKGYQLEEEFLDNWNVSNKNGKENIFSTQHASGTATDGSGGNHLAHCAFSSGFSNSTPHVLISDNKYYDAFDDRDQRKAGTYAKELLNPATNLVFTFTRPRFRKYIDISDPLGSASNRNIDRSILRYADILLVKAEAINELNNAPTQDAYEAINEVRRRAFRHFPVTEASTDDLPANLDYSGFKKAIQQERMFELTYEQSHWLDLVRWRIYVKTLKESGLDESYKKQSVSLKNYRFPIPQSQRNINPYGLWQNWGYDGYDESKTGANPYNGFN